MTLSPLKKKRLKWDGLLLIISAEKAVLLR